MLEVRTDSDSLSHTNKNTSIPFNSNVWTSTLRQGSQSRSSVQTVTPIILTLLYILNFDVVTSNTETETPRKRESNAPRKVLQHKS